MPIQLPMPTVTRRVEVLPTPGEMGGPSIDPRPMTLSIAEVAVALGIGRNSVKGHRDFLLGGQRISISADT